MLRFTRLGGVLATAAVAVVVAACSSQAGGATNPPAASAGAGSGVEIDVKQGGPGAYLADSAGKSLYVRTTDSANTTTCTGSCATAWPPLTLQAGQNPTAGAGVTGTLGSFKRPDGSTQATLNGMPLYYYSGDTSPGQTNGQGFQGIWFLAAPGGGPVGAPASGGAPAASGGMPAPTSGGGYSKGY